MMRVCNLDTCPCGVATQNPELRKRFCGKPEYVMNFMNYIAEELREIMASLGVRTVEELVGRTDLIKVREKTVTKRAAMADLSQILYNVDAPAEEKHFRKENVYNFELEKTVDESVIIPAFKTALKTGKPKTIKVEVSSTNRTVGTIFGSEITKKYKK